MNEKNEDHPIQKAMFTGDCGSNQDVVFAHASGLIPGRLYEFRWSGFRHGVEFLDVINIGKFNSAMFEIR